MAGADTRTQVDGHEITPVDSGWTVAATAAGAASGPAGLEPLTLSWSPASVPGTVAGALRAAGRWTPSDERDFDGQDWWFRTTIAPLAPDDGEELVLRLDGVATIFEAFIDGEAVRSGASMFEAHTIAIDAWADGRPHELVICCRALTPVLAAPRRPRARWRQQLVDGGLRFQRTMLLGRMPGIAGWPAAVGPWRPVVLERRRRVVVEACSVRTSLVAGDGIVRVSASLRGLGDASIAAVELLLDGPSGEHRAPLALHASRADGELRVPAVERWWPHTHGVPALHRVRLAVSLTDRTMAVMIDAGRVGFRTLAPGARTDHDLLADGLSLHVNDVAIFARGALWTPPDFVALADDEATLRAALERVRDCGMNMLRLPGTGTYGSAGFHDLCDELGILVWQDMMFANLDYPIADDGFRQTILAELTAELGALSGRPSLAVVCGNSEIEQQVAMLGLDPQLARSELFDALIPGALVAAGIDAPYVPSTPCGGERPFKLDQGVAHYYGVGGYRRPLSDVRRAGVRFASECLGFANVPDVAPADDLGPPRDAGSDWDFADVRDHYLELLWGIDAAALRHDRPARYRELSRELSGAVFAEVLGEWRRTGSPAAGGLVLWLHDPRPGDGWGLIDSAGMPKVALHHLRRICAPVAIWTVDEGLNGMAVHVANDRSQPLDCTLRVALYRDEQLVGSAEQALALDAHTGCERDIESLIGRFSDVTWAYRFGPPQQNVVAATLWQDEELLAHTVRFVPGPPLMQQAADELGLSARLEATPDAGDVLRVSTRGAAWGVRIHLPGHEPADDAFSIEPHGERAIALRRLGTDGPAPAGELTALNMSGRVTVAPGAGVAR